MILLRTVLHANFGKGGELAAEFTKMVGAMNAEMDAPIRWRVLTDLSGRFDTVVQEIELPSLAAWEESRPRLFASPTFRESFGRVQALIGEGRTELWTIEGQG